jgi:hypothetical protein
MPFFISRGGETLLFGASQRFHPVLNLSALL